MVKNHYEQIQGWFNCPNLYDVVIDNMGLTGSVVEIGCWKGRSAAYMAERIQNSGKSIQHYCVDTWEGTITEDHHHQDAMVKEGKLFEHFCENMQPFDGKYIPLQMTSLEAAHKFSDGSLDFVYIDASHDYQDVKDDINAWLPKVKRGGILAGDDYNSRDVYRAVHEVLNNVRSINRFTWQVQVQ